MEIEIHLKDRTITQKALPIQALLLEEFSYQEELEESFLANKLGMEVDKVKDICRFWERKGILANIDETWKVLETRIDLDYGNLFVS